MRRHPDKRLRRLRGGDSELGGLLGLAGCDDRQVRRGESPARTPEIERSRIRHGLGTRTKRNCAWRLRAPQQPSAEPVPLNAHVAAEALAEVAHVGRCRVDQRDRRAALAYANGYDVDACAPEGPGFAGGYEPVAYVGASAAPAGRLAIATIRERDGASRHQRADS